MSKASSIDLVKYESCDLSLFSFEYYNPERLLCDLCPEKVSLIAAISETDPDVRNDMENLVKGNKHPIHRLHIEQQKFFRRRGGFYLLYAFAENITTAAINCMPLIEHGTDSFFFLSEGEKTYLDEAAIPPVFSDHRWMKTGESWISWVAMAIRSIPCKYLFVPDRESLRAHLAVQMKDWEIVLGKLNDYENQIPTV